MYFRYFSESIFIFTLIFYYHDFALYFFSKNFDEESISFFISKRFGLIASYSLFSDLSVLSLKSTIVALYLSRFFR